MKAALKRKWIAALRSGDYKQTCGELYNKSAQAHCCLGVLYHCATGKNDLVRGTLAPITLKRVGLLSEHQDFLADKNDGGWGFKRIANWIEKNL
jgi:hypothetical protein